MESGDMLSNVLRASLKNPASGSSDARFHLNRWRSMPVDESMPRMR